MGMMKRSYWDNIVPIRPGIFPTPPRLIDLPPVPDTYGMIQHRIWWEENAERLHWRPIDTYQRLDPAMALATPFILRAVDGRWTYGAWIDGEWKRVTEGASWSLPDDFQPVEWADVDIEAAMLLGQE